MYITEKYWGGLIGGSDDSLTLVEHLAGKQKEEVPFGEIFSDFGLAGFTASSGSRRSPLPMRIPKGGRCPFILPLG